MPADQAVRVPLSPICGARSRSSNACPPARPRRPPTPPHSRDGIPGWPPASCPLGRAEEAEECYRKSIARDELLAGHVPDPSTVRWFQAENRHRLARLLIDDGHRDEARTVLEQEATDLAQSPPTAGPSAGWAVRSPSGWTVMADSFQEVGDDGRATQIRELAQQVRDRARLQGPNRGRHGEFGPAGRGHGGCRLGPLIVRGFRSTPPHCMPRPDRVSMSGGRFADDGPSRVALRARK